MSIILDNNRKELKTIENVNTKVNTGSAIKFRVNLICLCFMKLGSRSLATANMTIEEVENAVVVRTGEELRRNIDVKNHRSRKYQKKAVIPLNEIEYSWMSKYIKTYRPVLSKLSTPTIRYSQKKISRQRRYTKTKPSITFVHSKEILTN